MTVFKSKPGHISWLNYIVLTALLVGLFLVGLRLGNLVFAPPSQLGPASGADDKPSGGAIVNPPFQVHDFALINQAGVPMSLKDLRGRAVVLFFGYTHCPDVCPTTLADFARAKKLLGAAADRVAFVFVSVDPQRDTPQVMSQFLGHFDPAFIGLMGDDATLASMAAEYGAYFSLPADVQKGSTHEDHQEEGIDSDNYFVQHTSPSYLIDPKGFLRIVYFSRTGPEAIIKGIQQVLQESA